MNLKMLLQLCLCLFVTYGAQPLLASSGCAETLSETITRKYDSKPSLKFNFTRKQLGELRNIYHTLRVPGFVANISVGKDKPVNEMRAITEDFIETSKDGLAVFIPNTPVYHKAKEFKDYYNKGLLKKLKNNPEGLTLSTWFMHPELAKNSVEGAPLIKDLENKSMPYLASMLDLNKSHISHLKELERLSLEHIQKVYGVNESDDVKIYFHFPYSPKTVTLHLHIRVNQKIYSLEQAKSYSLSDVIRTLENGKSIEDLILLRQKELGGLYTNLGTAENLVRDNAIGSVSEEQNPFYTGE